MPTKYQSQKMARDRERALEKERKLEKERLREESYNIKSKKHKEKELLDALRSIYPGLEEEKRLEKQRKLEESRKEAYKRKEQREIERLLRNQERDLRRKAEEYERIKQKVYDDRNKRLYSRMRELDDINRIKALNEESREAADIPIMTELDELLELLVGNTEIEPEIERGQEPEIEREREPEIERERKYKPGAPLKAIEAARLARQRRTEEVYKRTGAKPKPKPGPKPKPRPKPGPGPGPGPGTLETLYRTIRDDISSTVVDMDDLEKITITDELEHIDDTFRDNPEEGLERIKDLALVVRDIEKGEEEKEEEKEEKKEKRKIDKEYKERLGDIESEEGLNEATKTVESEYLEGKIPKQEYNALMNVIKDRKKVIPVKVNIEKKILTPELSRQLYRMNKRPESREDKYITTRTQLLKKYLYI